ncbi:MAG TPA: imidazoleglycerol-phosphate dehydratase [Spirochaetales bacterium]|nr:imidazoleglycerol-phosphate dehydratase [Spirochaetales bacterium]HRY53949.1 imidazoleglycerol-phosphate dehydratase [Spirochaetia bacterium]HRZ64124.1 imidazoleglycerol-phosphate dehydratase [Spirochaetia bacterium]
MTSEAGRRRAAIGRRSRETEIALSLDLGGGEVSVDSGIGFLDHLVGSLALHAGWGLELYCRGDLEVDEHHSAEDCALALGEALARALASGPRPRRFASAYAPLDEALARAVVDLSGRPFCRAVLGLGTARLGALAGENAEHFVSSLAMAARATIHLEVLTGENAHHRAEAAFKALALALREACAPAGLSATGAAEAAASAKGAVLLEELSPELFAERSAALRARPAGGRR